jgi:hypothetical protein
MLRDVEKPWRGWELCSWTSTARIQDKHETRWCDYATGSLSYTHCFLWQKQGRLELQQERVGAERRLWARPTLEWRR